MPALHSHHEKRFEIVMGDTHCAWYRQSDKGPKLQYRPTGLLNEGVSVSEKHGKFRASDKSVSNRIAISINPAIWCNQ